MDDLFLDMWEFYEMFDSDFYAFTVDKDIPKTPYKPKTKLYIPDKRLRSHHIRNNC
jgi:hypothetical protein